MHLLRTQRGEISDGSEAIDLGQTPGEIIFLSAADTELALLPGDDQPDADLDRLCILPRETCHRFRRAISPRWTRLSRRSAGAEFMSCRFTAPV